MSRPDAAPSAGDREREEEELRRASLVLVRCSLGERERERRTTDRRSIDR
jgi:hypothetical protein